MTARQSSLPLSDDPAAQRQAADESRLRRTYRAWFQLQAGESMGVIPDPARVEAALEAIRTAELKLLPYEQDAVYTAAKAEWAQQTKRGDHP